MKSCFDAWYLAGRPSHTGRIREVLPEDEFGRKPSNSVIRKWMVNAWWDVRADELDARVSMQTDEELIRQKVAILKVQQERAMQLASKSFNQIMKEDFDSSNAAVNTYFKATEEERKIAGFSDLLERIEKMKNDELTNEIIAMLNRASENDQIIEAEDVLELEQGEEAKSQE